MPRGISKTPEETKRKQSEAMSGEKHPCFGKENLHKKDCKCPFCQAKRGELTGDKNHMFGKTTLDVHKPECSCFFCKIQRGELKGEKNNSWKGDDVGYIGMHQWVAKHKGKAKEHKCVDCEKQALHWSNKDHSYKRVLDDYSARCAKCHKRYDNNDNSRKKESDCIFYFYHPVVKWEHNCLQNNHEKVRFFPGCN